MIQVKVTPNANEDKVIGMDGKVLKVKVRASPEKGKANQAVIDLLAKHYKVPKRSVIIKSGETSRVKLFLIDLKPNWLPISSPDVIEADGI